MVGRAQGMRFGRGGGATRKCVRASGRCLANPAAVVQQTASPSPRKDSSMTIRRWLGLAVATGSTLALAAPAAQAAQDTTLAFGSGTVEVQALGVGSNTVRFTMRTTNPDTTRLFIDTHGTGRAYIALGNPTALGVAHAVYNDVSTDTCQVYTGTTFGEADEVPTADGSVVFDIRKDELAPVISLAVDDSAGGGADCRGFDGLSA